jgi:hypothetical protein
MIDAAAYEYLCKAVNMDSINLINYRKGEDSPPDDRNMICIYATTCT